MKRLSLAVLTAVLLVYVFPLISMVFASFFDFKAFQGTFPSFSLSQYRAFINDTFLHRQFANSVKITLASLLVQLPLSCLVSVSLLCAKHSFQKGVCFLLLVALILPFQSYMVPLFKLSKWTNLYDKQLSVILFEAFTPLAPLILFALSKSVSDEQIQAALLDTSSQTVVFLKIILPQILPGVCILVLLSFSDIWNLVEPALILLPDERLRPASISINDISKRSENASFAASVIYALPVVILYLFTWRIISRSGKDVF